MISISKLWNFCKGYVIISLYGFNADKLLDKATKNNIKIYDIRRESGKYTLRIEPKDFFYLRRLAKKNKCKVHILKKDGLFRLVRTALKNIFYPIGIAAALLFLFFMTQRIWLIDIEGNTTIDTYSILEYCSDNGLCIGCSKNKLNCRQLADDLKINFKNISWVNVSLKGSRIHIKMSEGKEKSVNTLDAAPCDIVSSQDCQIASIITTKGTPQVKAKDVVLSGDVLIASQLVQSGTEENPITDKVSAAGTVRGYVTRTYSFTLPYNKTVKEYTKIYSLKFINKLFSINYKPKYDKYDKITTITQLRLGENCPLPVVIYKDIYSEYEYKNIKLTEKEAKKEADAKITEHIITSYSTDSNIISVNTKYRSDKSKLMVSSEIVSEENVGREVPVREEMH